MTTNQGINADGIPLAFFYWWEEWGKSPSINRETPERIAMDGWLACLAAAPPVSAAEQPTGDLPALPEPWQRFPAAPEGSRDHFAADQMRDYARAAIAAHLARQSPAPEPAAPTAWLATDLDGRGDVAFTKEEAKRRAGESCTEFFPLYDAAPIAQEVTQQAGGNISDSILNAMYKAFQRGDSVERAHAAVMALIGPAVTQQAAKAETAEQPVNGIPATMCHDEGAVAHCFYCGRYSLDPATLSDRQPTCECGKQHGWSGSFKRPGPDAKWSGKAPDRAPTTSTVSASGALAAPDDVRDAKRYRLLRRHVKPGSISLPMRWVPPPLQTIEERIDMLCDAELECTDRAAHAATKSED